MVTPIEHLHVFRLKWSELSSLTLDEKAALSILGFLVSEINALKRLSLFSMFPHDENSDIAPAIAIQRNLILRTTTAKLFEFLRFMEKRLDPMAEVTSISRIFGTFAEELSGFRDGIGFRLAKQIRHKMANHLDFEEAKASAETAGDDVECSFYLTVANGNSYFPVGDEVVFASSLKRTWDSDTEENPPDDVENKPSFSDALDAWIEWILKLSDLADRVHLALFTELVEPLVPDRMAQHKSVWLESDLVANHPGFRLPIFIRTTE
jgi:hypothetical protein